MTLLTDDIYVSTDSDSDTSIHAHTNRGNKLKRRAKYVREGRLDDTGGLAHRKKINHAGYTRHIIANNPPLYDNDGDVFTPGESDNERGASPIEENAFGDVQLEHLLRPLTAASDLPNHPSLSIAYKSKALTQMADEALEMVRREKECLWKAKRLLQRCRGDADWVPCETFETEQDGVVLLSNEPGQDTGSAGESVTVEQSVPEMEGLLHTAELENGDTGEMVEERMEVAMKDGVETMDMAIQQSVEASSTAEDVARAQETEQERDGTQHQKPSGTNGDAYLTGKEGPNDADAENKDQARPNPQEEPLPNPAVTSIENDHNPEEGSEQTSNSGKDPNAPIHAMTTRARARSPEPSASASPTPSDAASIPPINPWFLVPPTSLPDRDLGLPATEAEETRRLLILYVQKQEQIVRSLQHLHDGLRRADRFRSNIYRACKAEAHTRDDGKGKLVTEMSDGEDWYDVEDYGLLRADLKVGKDGRVGLEKGKDEVEDGAEEEGRRGGRRRRVHRM